MITINETREVITKQILKEPQIYITGDSENGSRTLTIAFTVINESGVQIERIVKEYTGEAFNAAYSIYANDKALIQYALQDTAYVESVPLVSMPDNLENPVNENLETPVQE